MLTGITESLRVTTGCPKVRMSPQVNFTWVCSIKENMYLLFDGFENLRGSSTLAHRTAARAHAVTRTEVLELAPRVLWLVPETRRERVEELMRTSSSSPATVRFLITFRWLLL